ncbi:hypothetical protein RF11_06435 [Thelohanellus kitauei]|uniref:Uncharacterized protein n=1 Tax=Thelohanellus kitauei TaxID=669202 RepID=A0A0C2JT91_THEKT|nr:hypothetical protein RF11_06435 [Thelohanellus kitauei]
MVSPLEADSTEENLTQFCSCDYSSLRVALVCTSEKVQTLPGAQEAHKSRRTSDLPSATSLEREILKGIDLKKRRPKSLGVMLNSHSESSSEARNSFLHPPYTQSSQEMALRTRRKKGRASKLVGVYGFHDGMYLQTEIGH